MKTEIPRRACAALAIALLALAPPATAAANARDRLFETGALAELPAGSVLSFARERAAPAGQGVEAIADGALTVRVSDGPGGATVAETRFDEPEREIVVPPSPTTAAHPALLVFLETTVGSVSDLTGGSPFYIKNRFIEGFAQPAAVEPVELTFAGAPVAGERMLFRPFEGDPNVGRIGPLADLELAFVISDAVPGHLYSAEATATGYRHSLALQGIEAAR